MTKKTLPILFISFMTATAFAFSVNRLTWQISDTVTNAYLYEKLAKAEQRAKINDLKGAATLIDDLKDDAAAKDYVSTDGEPLELVLASASLWYRAEDVKNCCATNLFTPYDLFSAIDKAMAGEESFPQEELFYEAVTHKWPDINTIPEAIATNRVLNNNIFSLPKRK